jgi:hypothetical protein
VFSCMLALSAGFTLLTGATVTSAQDKEVEEKIPCASVPAPARTAFQKMFPKAVITHCATYRGGRDY